jgi:hypothetical protein
LRRLAVAAGIALLLAIAVPAGLFGAVQLQKMVEAQLTP